ncbi:MAG: NAD(P)H-dependent flavin oxidoreductase, partial [Megasphaera sp.]|uniref:NAD(P)H-dependent flavin oxidoreductase n=1 Tax=Megasphaera sp. TaxID=2023260 RepID=UPI003F0F638C
MKLPELKIGKLVAKVPIIQGGMAIRLSTARLAAAVANEGGIGLIAASGMPFEELRYEIRLARKLSPRGIIGINVMVAAREFKGIVTTAIEEGIDLVVAGAGFSRDMFAWGKASGTPIVPIVSSAKLAKISQSLGASAVVVEGAEAGGHLGTNRSSRLIVPEVRAAVDIPVIGAGGVLYGKDVAEMLRLGASGVQMGSRFAASVES